MLLHLDITNAFNSISRSQSLSTLFLLPQFDLLWRLTHWCYGLQSDLVIQDSAGVQHLIPSLTGVKQGDCLGSFLFAITIHPLLLPFSFVHNLALVSYLDDINIIAPPDITLSTFRKLQSSLSTLNLHINFSKTFLLLPSSGINKPLFTTHLPRLSSAGIPHNNFHINSCSLFGSFISFDYSMLTPLISNNLLQLQSFTSFLTHPSMPKQLALLFFRLHYLASPMHLLRTIPPSIISPLLSTFDSHSLNTYQTILDLPHFPYVPASNTNPSPSPFLEASLTVCLGFAAGGMGITRLSDVSHAAYCSAFATLASLKGFYSFIFIILQLSLLLL